MGYGLLWLESLAAALLLVSAATACHAQAKRGVRALLCLAVLAPLLVAAVETFASGFLAYVGVEHNWLAYTVSWDVCLVAGIAVILRRGLRRVEGVRPASGWPAARLTVGFAAALALHLVTLWNMDTTMRIRLSAVRLEAGAMVVAAAPLRVPDPQNAAFVYEKAFEAIQRINKRDPRWGPVYEAKSGTWYQGLNRPDFKLDPEFREFLKQHQTTLALLKRAAAMPGCYFERDYARPSLDMTLPELAMLREAARLLAADARVKAADGQVRAALENVAAIHAIAGHVTGEPMLVSGLVAVAVNETGLSALEGILTATTPAAADLAALPRDETTSLRRVLNRCLIGEEAFGLSAFAMLSGEDNSDLLYRELGLQPHCLAPLLTVPWRVFLLPDELTAYRKHLRDMRDLSLYSYQDAQAHIRELGGEQMARRSGILTQLILPALMRCFGTFTRAEARRRLGQLAVAVAAYHAQTGRFPAKLESLAPEYIGEVPLDPYDDQPLRFRGGSAGVTLYSIGPDLTDEGGKEYDSRTEKGDLVFRVGSVPAQAAAGSP